MSPPPAGDCRLVCLPGQITLPGKRDLLRAPLVPDDGPGSLGHSVPQSCLPWSVPPDVHSCAMTSPDGQGSRLTHGLFSVQTPGPVSPPGAADSGSPSPKHRPPNPDRGSEPLSPSAKSHCISCDLCKGFCWTPGFDSLCVVEW